MWEELYPRILRLALIAAKYDINYTIDAEEADRLALSLKLLDRLAHEPELGAWKGLGLAVQAYQKRCPEVIARVAELARRNAITFQSGSATLTESSLPVIDELAAENLVVRRQGKGTFVAPPKTDLQVRLTSFTEDMRARGRTVRSEWLMREGGLVAPEEALSLSLALTAREAEDDRIRGLDTGADDYLTKPFSFPVLVARLRAVTRRGAPARPAVLEAGDLRLDPASGRTWRGDTELELTARETALLACLMRHRGDLLSKQQILNALWDMAFDGDPNIVEVYIRHLRNKIDRPFARESIQTVRGAGYRLTSNGG